MDTKNENKVVRDARGRARRMARTGGGTYQRCLDAVAQAEGHAHWKAFMAAHPPEEGDASPDAGQLPASTHPDVSAMLRQRWLSGFTGEIEYERDAELTAAFRQRLAMPGETNVMHRLGTLVPGVIGAVAAGAIVALAVVRSGIPGATHAAEIVAVATIAPLLAVILGLAAGALVGDHPGARHLRVRCRSFSSGLQLCLFLYGYAGLAVGHQPRMAWLYADTTPAQILVRTVAGILLCNLLGRVTVKALILGGSMRHHAANTYA